jgi:Flp pilus assembly protein TadD
MGFALRLRRDFFADGSAAAGEGRHLDAMGHFQRALQKNPEDVRVLLAMGDTMAALGQVHGAEVCYRRVLAHAPGRREALAHCANLLRRQDRNADVIALLEPAVACDADDADLRLLLGSAFRDVGDWLGAENQFSEALRLSPGNPVAFSGLAALLAARGATDAALAAYDAILAGDPEHAQARHNRGTLLLSKGDFSHGWHDYEYRLRREDGAVGADHNLPLWNGNRSEGLRLLVTAEQGIGEQVMFASLIPELAALLARNGGVVILEADPGLVPLFARSFAGVCVRPTKLQSQNGRRSAHYEWVAECGGANAAIAIGSLAHRMRQAIADFPARQSYLLPNAAEKAQAKQWLAAQGAGPFVGVCWRGGDGPGARPVQAPLEAWAAFLRDVAGVPVLLQPDASGEDIAVLEQASGRKLLVPPELDQTWELDRTAALMAALDGVVSVPASVAWLSAGLGVPTLKVLPGRSWTAFGRDYEPFAPAAHCAIPKESGDWTDAFALAGLLQVGMFG